MERIGLLKAYGVVTYVREDPSADEKPRVDTFDVGILFSTELCSIPEIHRALEQMASHTPEQARMLNVLNALNAQFDTGNSLQPIATWSSGGKKTQITFTHLCRLSLHEASLPEVAFVPFHVKGPEVTERHSYSLNVFFNMPVLTR